MARNPIRDERQGDLFGAQPVPSKPQKPATPTRQGRAGTLKGMQEPPSPRVERTSRFDLDELVSGLSDADLAHVALAATKTLKRRLSRSQGRTSRLGPLKGRSPLERGIQDIAAELAEYGDSDEAW